MYVLPCAFPSVCIFIHVYALPCICPFMCIPLRMYAHPFVYPSVCMTLHAHFPSVGIFPPFVCPSLCICPPRVYIPSAWSPLRKYISLFCYSFMFMLPPRICPSLCTSLRVHFPSVRMFVHVYVPFVCFSSRVYVPLYDCCWNSNSPNNMLVLQFNREHKLTSVPTSVWSLGCVRWGTEAHVCAHVSWLVGVQLFLCQFRVCLVVIACPPVYRTTEYIY